MQIINSVTQLGSCEIEMIGGGECTCICAPETIQSMVVGNQNVCFSYCIQNGGKIASCERTFLTKCEASITGAAKAAAKPWESKK